jgi:hypothetical protein
MDKKQTAVDALKDFFKQYDLAHSSLDYYEFKIPMHIFDLKFQQAKEIEKERMIEFGELCWKNLLRSDVIMRPRDVYNETYGGNK